MLELTLGLVVLLLLCTVANAYGSDSLSTGSCSVYKCADVYKKNRSCQCNSGCSRYNDCCSDYKQVCDSAVCGTPGYGCNDSTSPLCHCDPTCWEEFMCCPQYSEKCHRPPGPPGPPGPPSPSPPTPPVGPKGPPEQFHLAPGVDGRSVTVSYASGKTQPTQSTCSMGTSPGKRPYSFVGSSSTYTDGGWNGVLHQVELSGLAADGATTYYYSCDGSTEFSFVSPPPAGITSFPLRIAAVADMGQECEREGGGCPNATFAALHTASAKGDFGLLLHAGDIAYTSGHQEIWDNYHRELEPIVSHVPYAVSPGNHEHYFNFSGYRHRYNMPGDMAKHSENLYWSFDWGGVHVLSYSTEHEYDVGSDQYNFIKQDLEAASAPAQRNKVPWIIVQGHRPFYCSTDDYYDCKVNGPDKLAPALEPLFIEYGVDIGLYGHVHNYERAWPTRNGTVEQHSYTNPKSPVHVVIGGSGDDEGLTNSWLQPQPPWSAYRIGTVDSMGYARMEFFNASTMSFGWYLAANNTKLDGFILSKDR